MEKSIEIDGKIFQEGDIVLVKIKGRDDIEGEITRIMQGEGKFSIANDSVSGNNEWRQGKTKQWKYSWMCRKDNLHGCEFYNLRLKEVNVEDYDLTF